MTPDRIARLLGRTIARTRPLAGGDLSQVVLAVLDDGQRLVAKAGPTARAEAEMLEAIAATGAPAPAVVACDEDLLVMQECAREAGPEGAWDDLARVLERLHAPASGAAPEKPYGWRADHAFGPVPIPNDAMADWPAFWSERRLLVHCDHVPVPLARRIERLCATLAGRLPAAPPPALLHGDLWGGNVLSAKGRVSALIDPACYFGDREVDLAMLTCFDGPPASFAGALGLEPGWQDRQPVYRLWPWLVHVRLFGSGYHGAVMRELDVLGV